MKRDYRLRLTKPEHDLIKNMRDTNANNILCVGDLHCPFELKNDKYLNFCIEKYLEFQCDEVVMLGDIVDNHFASFHEVNIDAEYTGKQELDIAIDRIARWRDAFPVATVIIGNHDRMVMRKAQTSSIPSKWIKSYKEVLEVPNWNFVERYVKNGVQYIHGEGGTARTKCRADIMNTVQGHLHTQAYCEHYVGQNFRVFGMQIGAGINFSEYSFAYAKYGKKPAIGCGVVLNSGKLPVNLLMEL